MRKSRFSLLVVATVIATILVAGCTSPTQTSPQVASTNTSTSSTTATSSSSAVKTAAPSVTPSPSASATPTAAASPTQAASPTPTASPTASGKIATSINGDSAFNSLGPTITITRNSPVSWGFEVSAQGNLLCGGTVTASIGSQSVPVTGTTSGCFETAYVNLSSTQTNSLKAGTSTLTVRYAGDSTHQPSEPLTRTIIVK
jgi:outer membrane murein-binding lipoprotein Lpp